MRARADNTHTNRRHRGQAVSAVLKVHAAAVCSNISVSAPDHGHTFDSDPVPGLVGLDSRFGFGPSPAFESDSLISSSDLNEDGN
ncbi:hypothetical protein EVAR_3444_1 [Eumeta japonica]|uniref:Uncharacterized protein n=1 Tax=Eumeta variegata TaxID=151549 RepID=A0A4C1SSM1_EUMVA|nr:hypothetical protein EVAR_3444_1 [Eumeta japonica]